MKKLNKKGFTLVELLAVIVILGVIMLIAIPSVGTIIKNSRENSFVSSGKMYISTAQNYVAGENLGNGNYCISVNTLTEGKVDKSPINPDNNIEGYVLIKIADDGITYEANISDGVRSASRITSQSDREVMDEGNQNYKNATCQKTTSTVDGNTVTIDEIAIKGTTYKVLD